MIMRLCRWLAGLAVALALSAQAATTQYVDGAVGGGNNDGTSWANAFNNVTNALAVAGVSDQVWVARGVYKPGTNISARFLVNTNWLALYGGFTNGMASLGERNWTSHVTMLSGDVSNTPGDMSDNCSNVVIIAKANCTLDGFTIAYSSTNAGSSIGGGLYVSVNYASSTVANCTFTSNMAQYGGGMYINYPDAGTLISNCTFSDNQIRSAQRGGGIYMTGGSRCRVVDCTFRSNSCGYGGGFYSDGSSPMISNCLFLFNYAYQGGGFNNGSGTAAIWNCTFSSNITSPTAEASGGGIYNSATLILMNSVICKNYSEGKGAGTCVSAGSAVISNCVFVGNRTANSGGGVAFLNSGSGMRLLTQCAFVGNYSPGSGGGIYSYLSRPGTTIVVNGCTVWRNYSLGIYDNQSYSSYTNCIVWDNTIDWYLNISTSLVSYTCVTGFVYTTSLVTDGGGNLNTNPLFADSVTGSWTAAGSYDPNLDRSTLVATNANWTPNEHAGKAVRVDTNSLYTYFYVVTNTATTMVTQARSDGIATNGVRYEIIDAHEKSRNGRYTPVGWRVDPVHSPCIDAGDPVAAWALEPVPNGRRINMGCYGNTPQASMTYVPHGTIFLFR